MRESLEGLLTDPRKPRGKRHPLPSPVSVMVAGVASGHGGAQAVAQAASWDQDVLAGHGCRISPARRGRARGGPGVSVHRQRRRASLALRGEAEGRVAVGEEADVGLDP